MQQTDPAPRSDHARTRVAHTVVQLACGTLAVWYGFGFGSGLGGPMLGLLTAFSMLILTVAMVEGAFTLARRLASPGS